MQLKRIVIAATLLCILVVVVAATESPPIESLGIIVEGTDGEQVISLVTAVSDVVSWLGEPDRTLEDRVSPQGAEGVHYVWDQHRLILTAFMWRPDDIVQINYFKQGGRTSAGVMLGESNADEAASAYPRFDIPPDTENVAIIRDLVIINYFKVNIDGEINHTMSPALNYRFNAERVVGEFFAAETGGEFGGWSIEPDELFSCTQCGVE